MADPLRALIVDLAVRFGGANARVLGLMSRISPGRIALAGLEASPVLKQGAALGFEVHTVGRSRTDPFIPVRLKRLIRNNGFQLLDVQNPQAKFWGSIVAARTGVALVSTLNSWYESEHRGSLKGRLYQTVERLTASVTDLYIAVSKDIHRRLLAEGLAQEAVFIIPNAIELAPVASDKAWLSTTFGLPRNATICCAVGRLAEAKGFHHLINSMGLLAARLPDLHCLIVGEGHLRDVLTHQIERMGLSSRVHLLGFRDRHEILKIESASDVFVMPSTTEGTPIALLEAAALARPIAASKVGGIPDLVNHGEHALLVEPGDERALVGAILRLVENPEEATIFGKQAQEHVKRNFNLETQADVTLTAYQVAFDRARRRVTS